MRVVRRPSSVSAASDAAGTSENSLDIQLIDRRARSTVSSAPKRGADLEECARSHPLPVPVTATVHPIDNQTRPDVLHAPPSISRTAEDAKAGTARRTGVNAVGS